MAEMLRAPKGLDGVAVADTTIAKSDADGTLIYEAMPSRTCSSTPHSKSPLT